MSFALYLAGFAIFIAGVAWALVTAGVPGLYVAIGSVILRGAHAGQGPVRLTPMRQSRRRLMPHP